MADNRVEHYVMYDQLDQYRIPMVVLKHPIHRSKDDLKEAAVSFVLSQLGLKPENVYSSKFVEDGEHLIHVAIEYLPDTVEDSDELPTHFTLVPVPMKAVI